MPARTFPRTSSAKITHATPPRAKVMPMNRPAHRLPIGSMALFEGPEGGGDLNLVIRLVKDGRTTIIYKDRNYLEEFEVMEPNFDVRDQIKDLDARHGRHVGHEFG